MSCYHKCGTVLFSKTLRRICGHFGWRYAEVYQQCYSLPSRYDVVLLAHSLATPEIMAKMHKGIHIIRDPRDIIVSGYLYHLRCSEPWCINTDLDPSGDLVFPKVPTFMSMATRDEQVEYLNSLNKMSYQENLNARDRDEGLLYEMERFGQWTINCMRTWDYTQENVMELKFEDLLANYQDSFAAIFAWLDFSPKQTAFAVEIAGLEDFNKMSNTQKLANPHISSPRISKWAEYFTDGAQNTIQRALWYRLAGPGL